MEGLLPFLYRAILHLANGGQTPIGNPFRNESPPESPAPYYVRLAGAGADVHRARYMCVIYVILRQSGGRRST